MKVSVLGSGSFGTAIANVLGDKGYNVFLYARRKELVDPINEIHENVEYLKGFKLSENIFGISGPSFAKEIVQRFPTLVSIASRNEEVAKKVQNYFYTSYFRTYWHDDVIGVEIGGALKNVIAIACGVSDGLNLGHNTRAALITRGLVEIQRLGVKKGANPITFLGLTGLGDLVLTCTGELSRNRTVGYQLGQGKVLSDIIKDLHQVAEGVYTAKSAFELSKKFQIEMPITESVYKMLYENIPPKEIVKYLMQRELKKEF